MGQAIRSARDLMPVDAMRLGGCRLDLTLQPVSGKALPLYRGEVLRITQVAGAQCVDFNCFNLHDYKERMSVGQMRQQGFRPKQGHVAVSNAPRYRPMLAVEHMSETCVTDLLGARCFAVGGEAEYGLLNRTNCQDTFAESIREFRLTPDDVHDSFNMWMHTIWADVGYTPVTALGPPGDYVDLLALMDVLAVPIICGSGDIGQISNFQLKPIRLQVFEATSDSSNRVDGYLHGRTNFLNQRTRADYRVQQIQAQRELKQTPRYQPQFRKLTEAYKDVDVELGTDEFAALERLGLNASADTALRMAFLLWYQANRMKQHWLRP